MTVTRVMLSLGNLYCSLLMPNYSKWKIPQSNWQYCVSPSKLLYMRPSFNLNFLTSLLPPEILCFDISTVSSLQWKWFLNYPLFIHRTSFYLLLFFFFISPKLIHQKDLTMLWFIDAQHTCHSEDYKNKRCSINYFNKIQIYFNLRFESLYIS